MLRCVVVCLLSVFVVHLSLSLSLSFLPFSAQCVAYMGRTPLCDEKKEEEEDRTGQDGCYDHIERESHTT